MAGEDWLAALVGSLQGGVEGLQFMQRAKQDKEQRQALAERQRMQDALAAEDRAERQAERDERRRDRSRTNVSSMLEEIGRGGRLAPEQAAQVRDLDLGHRLEETPDFQNSYFAQAGPVPMMVPEVSTTVAPTAAERLADQEQQRERARRAQIAAGIADPYERQAFEADPTKYKPTRESFVPLPIRQREAVDAEDAKIDAEVRKSNALLPIKLREKEEGERLQRKYAIPAAPRDERLVQIMGPKGTPIWVRESQAVNQPAAQAARAVTGAERQSLAYYNRAKEAVDTLTAAPEGRPSLEERIASAPIGRQLQLQNAPNILQTSEQQAYRQAQRAFTEARLRKESGAAIPTAEYENDARTYFAQPGDTPATIEQKRKARNTVLEGLKFGSGKAYQEYYGDEALPAGGVTVPDPRGGKTADPLGIR